MRRELTTGVIVVAVCLAAGTLLAQSALVQVGLNEAFTRDRVLEAMKNGGPSFSDTYAPWVANAATAMKKLPPVTRAQLTTQLYAWTKAYLSTPAFKAAYAKARTEATPEARVHQGTVEDELKVKINQFNSDQEAGYKMLEGAGQKAEADKMRKEGAQMLAQLTPGFRNEIVEQRAKDKADYEMLMKQWQLNNPPDPNTLVARALREFLDTTVDVDFAAATKLVQGEGERPARSSARLTTRSRGSGASLTSLGPR